MIRAPAGAEKNIRNAAVDKAMSPSPPIIPGFFLNGLASGIKKDGQNDLGLIFSEAPAVAGGVFTRNWIKAAPVILTQQKFQRRHCQAVLVNSGNANACTGKRGIDDANALVKETARQLDISPELVAIASTGVIGEFLPLKKMLSHLPSLCKGKKGGGIGDFARAIMTTDTVPKIVYRRGMLAGKKIIIAGIGKGAGMINPSLATMLVFILTNAAIRSQSIQSLLKEGTDKTLNRITVDGDTSTNDMVIMLANGLAKNTPLTKTNSAGKKFSEMLLGVMEELAQKILLDGEGVTKMVEIKVKKAKSRQEAVAIARSIAYSPLVKTSFYGEELNWGRIIAAAGKTHFPIAFEKTDLFINQIPIVRKGAILDHNHEKHAQQEMTKICFKVTLILHQGNQEASILTTDLSPVYVKINAGYKT